MREVLKRPQNATGDLDSALRRTPSSVDGGEASSLIAVIISGAVESAGLLGSVTRTAGDIARDVVDDLLADEDEITTALREFRETVFD